MPDAPLRWLFLDLNAYFASVEQQDNPALRGQPVAVIPVKAEHTSCIAVSYEARRYGIRTGTSVAEARRRCRQIHLVVARNERYVQVHHRVKAAIEQVRPIDKTPSIDEMAIRLAAADQPVEKAMALATELRRKIAVEVGECLRCSIGIAPNLFLAKLASDRQKPDGLTVLGEPTLLAQLHAFELSDLPGFGDQTLAHLSRAGITTVRQLAACDRLAMRDLWGSVWGERYYDWLRGLETPEPPPVQTSIGHSRVLEPSRRTTPHVWRALQQLAARATHRLREAGRSTTGLIVAVRYYNADPWEGRARFDATDDTAQVLKTLGVLCPHIPTDGTPYYVSATLTPLKPIGRLQLPLFDRPHEPTASTLMDRVNRDLGRDALTLASLQRVERPAPKISFGHIPAPSDFPSVPGRIVHPPCQKG